jgi:uncharacterized membrane protein HdeD (DUF308 family)
MSLATEKPAPGWLRHELHVLQGAWVWYLALGVALIVLGLVALTTPLLATLTTVTFISVLLIVGGVGQAAGAFGARRWTGFFALLLVSILYLVVGLVTLGHPVGFAAGLTLVIAVFLMGAGMFRVVVALATRIPHWSWMLAHGVLALVLGILIWRQWPEASLWVIGIFVGLDLIFSGWTWVMLALAMRSLTRPAA